MKMFRIILELNDYTLLKKLKPRLMSEVSRDFFSLYSGHGIAGTEGDSLVLEAGDIAADYLAEGVFRFYRGLIKKRLLLHGFFLGVDYASPAQGFSAKPDGQWRFAVSDPDALYITEAANDVVMPFMQTEGDGPLLHVTGIFDSDALETQAFQLFAEKENLSLVHTVFTAWKNGPAGERPIFIHSLRPAEQYRLAVSAAAEAGAGERFPLVDLNYPWRSLYAAFVGAFGPDPVAHLAPAVDERFRQDWIELGKSLFQGENLFCEADALSWLSRAFPAYAGIAKEAGAVPVVLLLGADRMNRVARRIVEGIIAPLHERGRLFCLLMGSRPPRYQRAAYGFAEFRKAPVRGDRSHVRRLYTELHTEDRKLMATAALFAPFLPVPDLLGCLYRIGYPRQKIDSLFSRLVSAGGACSTWRYFFPCPEVPYRLSREDYQRKGISELLEHAEKSSPAPFGVEYASIAAMLFPEKAVQFCFPLLKAIHGLRSGTSMSSLLAVFGMLKGRNRSLAAVAGLLLGRDQGYGDSTRGIPYESAYETEIASLVDVVAVGNLLQKGDHLSALARAKEVLFRVQENNSPCHIARAQLSVGSSMLCMGRVEEANDYFTLAYETSKSCGNPADRIEACIRRGISLFLYGNYSRADRQLSDGIGAVAGICYGDSLLFSYFLKGRIAFTLGRYAEAEELFWTCLSLATVLGKSHYLFYGWIGRSRVYVDRIKEGLDILKRLPRSAEILYYTAEGLLFGGEIAPALEQVRHSEVLIRSETPANGCFGQYNWHNGYSNVEDCAFRGPQGRRVMLNCISALRWYLESLNGDGYAGRSILEKITREEKLGELDPFYHFYYLVHALLIPEDTHNESLERITYLSKGLKYLQRIGSVIDDVSSRLDFINKNRWNRVLMDIARNEKLV
jgi:tetratricopeptide (TPR) repeat protein